MSDLPGPPGPPPGWEPPNPPTTPPSPPPASPPGYPPPPPPSAPPGWAAPTPASTSPPPPPAGTLPPPPGAPGFGYGYAPYGPAGVSKPLGGISTALAILLGLTSLAALGVAGALNNRVSVLDDAGSNFQDIQDADDLAIGTTGLYSLLFIATIVLWMVWQFRHAKNAEALGKRDGLGAGWAIGGWFIPIANFILGPLQLYQSAKSSDPESPGVEGRVPGSVIAWWVLWVGQAIVGVSSGRFFSNEETDTFDLEEFRSSDQLGSVAAVVTAVCGVVAIVMVRQLTTRQKQALQQQGMPG